jgi:hypothetical protein
MRGLVVSCSMVTLAFALSLGAFLSMFAPPPARVGPSVYTAVAPKADCPGQSC